MHSLIGFFFLLLLQNIEVEGSWAEHYHHDQGLFAADFSLMLTEAGKAAADGDYDLAIDLYSRLTHFYEHNFGPEDSNTITILILKYEAYFAAKRYDEALLLAWKIYKLREKTLGKEHLSTLYSLVELGNTYYMKKKYEKAEGFLKKAYKHLKSQLGQNHEKTIQLLHILADVYRTGGAQDPDNGERNRDLALALRYYRKVYDVRSQRPELGLEHEGTVQVFKSMGDVLALTGKTKEAEEIFRKVLEIRSRRLGPGHPLTLEAKKAVFLILSGSGRTREASKILWDANGDYKEDHFPDESLFILVEGRVSKLDEEGKYEKAVAILSEFYEHEVLKLRGQSFPAKILAILDKLVLFSRQTEADLDEKLKWANVALDLIENQNEHETKQLKIKLTTKEDEENLTILYLHAITSHITVHSKKGDEEKVEEAFKRSVKFLETCNKIQQESVRVFQTFSSLMECVVDFKERIGKMEDMIHLYDYLAKHVRHGNISLFAVGSFVNLAVEKNDYRMLLNTALEYFNNNNDKQLELESKDRLKVREETTNLVFHEAQEQFHLENYEMSFTLYKTMEAIWPKEWSPDPALTRVFMRGITQSAIRLRNYQAALFYLRKQITTSKITTHPHKIREDEEGRRIGRAITTFEKIKQDFQQLSEMAKVGKVLQSSEDSNSDSESIQTSLIDSKPRNEL